MGCLPRDAAGAGAAAGQGAPLAALGLAARPSSCLIDVPLLAAALPPPCWACAAWHGWHAAAPAVSPRCVPAPRCAACPAGPAAVGPWLASNGSFCAAAPRGCPRYPWGALLVSHPLPSRPPLGSMGWAWSRCPSVRAAGRSALAEAEFCFPPVVLTPASPLPSRDPVWNSGPTCRPQPVLAVAPLAPSPFGPRGFLCRRCSGRAAPGHWVCGAERGRRRRCRGQAARNAQLRAPAARGSLGPFCPCRVGGCLLPRPAPGVFAVTAADGPQAPRSTVSGSGLGPPRTVSGSARSAACPSLFPAAGDAGGGCGSWPEGRKCPWAALLGLKLSAQPPRLCQAPTPRPCRVPAVGPGSP